MAEGLDEEFPEALLPLLEIENDGKKLELTKELLEFAAKVFASHGKKLDEAMVHKALKPIFRGKEKEMMKTIFDEKYDVGLLEGRAEGEAKKAIDMTLRLLRKKFHRVPKDMENRIRLMVDPIALDSLAESILDCSTLDEFAEALK
jgi:hypothetical protein